MTGPYLRLFVGDYLRDTKHLTCEQHGAYLQLLMTMWSVGGRLPNDRKKLARIVGLTPHRWAAIAPDVLDFFEEDGGEIVHPRLKKEIEDFAARSEKKREAGRAGAAAKWLKNHEPAMADAIADAMPLLRQPRSKSTSASDKSLSDDKSSSSVVGSPTRKGNGAGVPDAFDEVRAGPTPTGRAWAAARLVLIERGGMSKDAAGAFIGKLMRDHKLSPDQLFAIAEAAWKAGTQDPKSYLVAAADSEANRSDQITAPPPVQQRRWAEEYRDSPHLWRPERGPEPGRPGCRISPEILAEFGLPSTPERSAA